MVAEQTLAACSALGRNLEQLVVTPLPSAHVVVTFPKTNICLPMRVEDRFDRVTSNGEPVDHIQTATDISAPMIAGPASDGYGFRAGPRSQRRGLGLSEASPRQGPTQPYGGELREGLARTGECSGRGARGRRRSAGASDVGGVRHAHAS